MPNINLTGISTGIDTNAIVQQLIAAEQGPINLLKHRQQVQEDKKSAFGDIQTRMTALQTALAKLDDASTLRAYNAKSSDDSAISVEASASASEGSHQIVVDRLATAERDVHGGLAALDAAVGVGTLSYTYNGATRTLQTADSTTLEGLRDIINNDAGNPGVTASILQYDSGDGRKFHLVLNGNDSGADYAITINNDQTTLNGSNGTADFTSASFTRTQDALNSRLQVDGYPDGGWIERSTNTVDDVLPGVTLHLHKPGDLQVSVTRNTDVLKTNLGSWVSAYNSLMNQIKIETAYDEVSKTAGLLMGDSAVTAIVQQLRTAFIKSAIGFKDGVDPFTLAGEIGLSVDKDGKLALDNDKLDEAISKNYNGVLSLLGAVRSGASDSSNLQFYGTTGSTAPGAYDVKATFDGSGTLLSAKIKLGSEGESAWRDATIQGNVIIGGASGPEKNLQVTAAWDGVSTTQTAQVRVRQGIAGSFNDTVTGMLNKQNGVIQIAQKNCQTSIDTLQKNIDNQQVRITAMEKRLRAQYARLEAILTQLQAQLATLTQNTTSNG